MKKAQSSVAIILVVITIVLITIILTIIMVNSSLFSYKSSNNLPTYEKNNEKNSLNFYYQEEIICNKPYIQFGTSCCLDTNYNSVCDNDELVKESKDTEKNLCDYPYQDIDSKCCIDDNRNGRCDYDDRDDRDDRRDIDEDAFISRPFSIIDFEIERDDITLWIKNRGDKTVMIKSIEIEDCDDFDEDVTLEENEKEKFDFDCDRDNRFDRDIRVTYIEEDSSIEKTARGNIERDYKRNYDDRDYRKRGYDY